MKASQVRVMLRRTEVGLDRLSIGRVAAARILPLPLILAVTVIAHTGCVATRFQAVSNPTSPIELQLQGSPAKPVSATLETVIVYDGPGAWKRRAYWDEYVISVSNLDRVPVRLHSAFLIDAHGVRLAPGSDWEALERESADWWKRNVTAGNLVLGASGTVFVAAGGGATFVLGVAAMIGAAPVAAVAAGVALVGFGGASVLDATREDSRERIVNEFDRRRLRLPAPLPFGGTVNGSLFFRITPSPRELVLNYESRGRMHSIKIDLAALAGLHRRPGASR